MDNKIYIVNSVQHDKEHDVIIPHLVGMYDSLEKAIKVRDKYIDNLNTHLNPRIDSVKWTTELAFDKISNGKGLAVPKTMIYDDEHYYLGIDLEKRKMNSSKFFVI